MRNGGKELEKTDEFAAELKTRKWREIDSSHRLKMPTARSLRDTKTRVTIYIDSDILMRFRELAEQTGGRYQSLINDALRPMANKMDEKAGSVLFKEEILADKKFIKRLKTALDG